MNYFLKRSLVDHPLILGTIGDFLMGFNEPMAAEHPGLKQFREKLKPKMEITGDGLAVIPVDGVLARKPDPIELAFMGYEDTRNILEMVNAAGADKAIKGILLSIDSPGGFVTGGPEVADAVKAAGKSKPVFAHTDGMAASLAYWIGSQAQTFIASRSAQVGSIGAYTAFMDASKAYAEMGLKMEVFKNKEADFKAMGIPGTSLNDDQRAYLQEGIQNSFKDFQKAVLTARPQVEADSMRGQVFNGMEAKRRGLIDVIGGMNFALSMLKRASVKN